MFHEEHSTRHMMANLVSCGTQAQCIAVFHESQDPFSECTYLTVKTKNRLVEFALTPGTSTHSAPSTL
jgi:hypothetical protein